MNIEQAKQVMLATHKAALMTGTRAGSIELIGTPGCAKSEGGEQYAAQMARDINQPVGLLVCMIASYASVDARGFMIPVKDPDGGIRPMTVFSVPPWMPTRANCDVFMPDGRHFRAPLSADMVVPDVGVLYLDEWGQGEDDVKKSLAEVMYKGGLGNDRLPAPGWRVIAASNNMGDRAGVVRPMTHITNRRMELHVEGQYPVWEDWCNALPAHLRPHHYTISFAHQNPNLVFRENVPPGNDPFCTPRSLVAMDRDLRALRTDEDIERDRLPVDFIAREVARGHIGPGESAQFMTHLKYADEIPMITDIERDPMRAKLPKAPDAQMVCAFMLGNHVTEGNAAKIMKYMGRMDVEHQALAMKQVSRQQERAQFMMNIPECAEWFITNKDLLIASKS